MKQKLGKVSISPKGEWNNTTAYECLDTVNFGGGSWLAKRANTAVSPVEGDDWMQLSAKGADAEVTKDSIVEALGYEPDESVVCELVQTITISEETSTITLTQDDNGNAYNFKCCFVKAKFPSSTLTGNIGIRFSSGNNTLYGYFMNPRPKNSVLGYSAVYVNNLGYWDVELYYCSYGSGAVYSVQDVLINHGTYTRESFPAVDKIYIFGGIAAGTVFEIYAVRA